MQKVGRNDLCPCGSGRKFKKCCLVRPEASGVQPAVSAEDLKLMKARLEAQERQREQQQGKGKPIISAETNGIRFVAVGNQLHYSDRWKTFHDFLFGYLGGLLGAHMGNDELKKPLAERHPIARWHHHVCMYQRQTITTRGKVSIAPATGAVSAYLELAYNLYLLAHNQAIQSTLVKRLLNKDQFHGAYYETYVAATLIKAGCDLAFENESDGSQSHCEFTATFRATGNHYSVEAKSRMPDKPAAKIGSQLHNALCKQADFPRIIFIDVNVPDTSRGDLDKAQWMKDAMKTLREKEDALTVHGQPAPPAYVILTNHPYQYCLDTTDFRVSAIAEGFKIPDFKVDALFPSIRAAVQSRERHADILALVDSIRVHHRIPSTFDAEIPAFMFGTPVPRLLVGEKYRIPGDDGKEEIGELVDAVVSEDSGTVYGFYKTAAGKTVLVTCPLSAEELAAYKEFPDTFFGIYKPQSKKVDGAVELFDWFHTQYKNASKASLLKLLAGAPDYADLQLKEQKELAFIYCERLVHSFPPTSSKTPPIGID